MNRYERDWKIQTSAEKFKLLSVSTTKPAEVIRDNNVIPFSRTARVLGLPIISTGISTHIKTRTIMAINQFKKLNRFKRLEEKINVQLYKALTRPIL